jgi:ubiquinone/menaquinone biosynthesis C-methylase UbiE
MADSEALRVRDAYTTIRTFEQRMCNRGFRRLTKERDAAMAKLLANLKKPIEDCRVLDLGCGTGYVTNWFHVHGVPRHQIVGVDILHDSIRTARQAYPHLTFLEGNGEHLPFLEGTFDLVICFTLFSSILDNGVAKRVAAEAERVLTKDGEVMWRDMRYPNPWNKHIRPMTRTMIRDLFPGHKGKLKSVTLLPPLAERLGNFTNMLYPLLVSIPFLRSHYFGLLQ